ncbi:MAG: hypothetical protein KJ941_01345 [Bacteroidetes bacterium]|nr:hypothetical protein [Bacteroidota bacterium]
MKAELHSKKLSFYLIIAIIMLLVVLAGFSKTYIIPIASNQFLGHKVLHLHGFFTFSWVALFVTQTALIHYSKQYIHRKLGFLGLFMATGVLITMIPAGLFGVERDLKLGLGESSYSALLGVIISGVLFLSLVISGVLKRSNPSFHKRLILLATIVVIWPSWFRLRHFFSIGSKP